MSRFISAGVASVALYSVPLAFAQDANQAATVQVPVTLTVQVQSRYEVFPTSTIKNIAYERTESHQKGNYTIEVPLLNIKHTLDLSDQKHARAQITVADDSGKQHFKTTINSETYDLRLVTEKIDAPNGTRALITHFDSKDLGAAIEGEKDELRRKLENEPAVAAILSNIPGVTLQVDNVIDSRETASAATEVITVSPANKMEIRHPAYTVTVEAHAVVPQNLLMQALGAKAANTQQSI